MSVCKWCHGGCCRRYQIDLTGYDIFNISNTLDLEIPFFVHTDLVKDENVEKLSEDAALFKFTDDGCKNYRRFCLRKIESTLVENSLKCMFLQEWDGDTLLIPGLDEVVGRCGIYGVRPLICATYPARMDQLRLQGFLLDPNVNCEKKENPAYNLCPRSLTENDFVDTTGEITRNLALQKYEMDFFKKVAEEWNSEPGSLKEFFKYLAQLYSNRITFLNYKQKKK